MYACMFACMYACMKELEERVWTDPRGGIEEELQADHRQADAVDARHHLADSFAAKAHTSAGLRGLRARNPHGSGHVLRYTQDGSFGGAGGGGNRGGALCRQGEEGDQALAHLPSEMGARRQLLHSVCRV